MIRTATPRADASRIAPATTAAVSGARWKSYCASSSDVRASPIQSAIVCAISSGCCPPSVRVRTVSFVEELAAAEIGATFNFYREGPRAGLLRRRLGDYLAAHEHARFLLVGEAPGYRGARVSGVPFTSERQLTGAGPAEATATIVHRVLGELGIADDVLLWNVVPTHPGTATSNRRPTRAEVRDARPFLDELTRGRRVVAVGRLAPQPCSKRRTSGIPRTAAQRHSPKACGVHSGCEGRRSPERVPARGLPRVQLGCAATRGRVELADPRGGDRDQGHPRARPRDLPRLRCGCGRPCRTADGPRGADAGHPGRLRRRRRRVRRRCRRLPAVVGVPRLRGTGASRRLGGDRAPVPCLCRRDVPAGPTRSCDVPRAL